VIGRVERPGTTFARAALRSLASIAGLSLVAGASVALMSLSTGMTQHPAFAGAGPEHATQLRASRGFDLDTRARLRHALPGVSVGGAQALAVRELAPPLVPIEELRVLAADSEWLGIMGYQLEHGRSFSDEEAERAARVCLVSPKLARGLAGAGSPVGRSVRLDDVWLTVVGGLRDREGQEPPHLVVPLETGLRRMVPESPGGPSTLLVDIPADDGAGQALLQRVHARLVPTSGLAAGDKLGRDGASTVLTRALAWCLALLLVCASTLTVWIVGGLPLGRSRGPAALRGATGAVLLALPGLLWVAWRWPVFAAAAGLEPSMGLAAWLVGLGSPALLGLLGGAWGLRGR
jgi:hypothetical protein